MKRFPIILFLIFTFTICVFFVLPPKQVEATEIVVDMPISYVVGDKISIPSAVLSSDGKSVDSTSTVVFFPDGSASIQTNFVAKQHGVYTVRWSAKIDNNTIFAEKSFIVQKDIVSFSSSFSSFYYGDNDYYKTSGINVSIKNGDECRINRILDLSECTFSRPFISISFTPLTLGKVDAYRFYMKLTDVHDEDNYVIVRMQNWSDMGAWADGMCYMDARAVGQDWTSCVTQDSDHHKRGEQGKGWYIANVSMTGVASNDASTRRYDTLNIFYDAVSKRIVTNSNQYGADCLIDFDDPYWYDLTKESLWKGFTTGECYVSFYADNYNASSANICIKKLLELDLEEREEDSAVPSITVDTGDNLEEELPFAVVGEKYKIFPASAYDIVDGPCRVIANAYRKTDTGICIYDIVDGCFTPDREGDYMIVYAAKDASGNKATKTLDISCQKEHNNLSVTVNSPLMQTYTGLSCKVFDSFAIENANGDTNCSISVTTEEGEIYAILDPENPVFTPVKSGIYYVIITVEDYVITKREFYSITVIDNPDPIIEGNPIVPRHLIVGANYTFDFPEAYFLSEGNKNNVDCQIFISESGGSRKEIDNTYTPSTAGPIEIIFSAQYNGRTTEKSVTTVAVDVGYGKQNQLHPEQYFYDQDDKVYYEVTEDDIRLATESDTEVYFINKIQAYDLTIVFDVLPEFSNMEMISITLTDSIDPSINLVVNYRKDPEGTLFSLGNGDSERMLKAKFTEESSEKLMLSYYESSHRVFGSNDIYWDVKKDASGKAFNGFPSGYVYFSIKITGVQDTAKVKMYSVNSQQFYDFTRDTVKPQIIVYSRIPKSTIGDRVTLSRALMSDVLDPTLRYSLKVVDPEGNFVRSVDGVLLDGNASPLRDYTFDVNYFGTYTVSYECYDSTNSRPTYYGFGFESVDKESPKVTLKNAITTAKIGESVTVALAEVEDNVSPNCTVKVILLSPDGVMKVIGENFTANITGNYIVYYYVYDEMGNSTIVNYTVVVTK